MHNRERGAAHINVYYFLVLLLLFFGAIGWAYYEMTQKREFDKAASEAIEAKDKSLNDLLIYKEYAKAITQVMGEPGTFNPPTHLADPKPAPLEKVSVPKKLRDRMGDLANKLQLPGATTNNIASLSAAVASKFDALNGLVVAAESARKAAETNVAAQQATFQTTTNTKDATIAKNSREFSNRTSALQAEITRQEQKTQSARRDNNTLREDIARVRNEHQTAILGKDKVINTHKLQLEHMTGKVRTINPPDKPDGKVISASMNSRLAFIDIGRKDMLQTGITFRITAPPTRKVPNPPVKALGTVVKVMDDRAEVRLSKVRDEYDPITRGDEISNALYTPNLRRTVALIGRFSYPYRRPQVKTLLERFGNTVVEKVDVGVDLVIVGSGEFNDSGELNSIKDHPGYKKAEDLRMEIISLNRIRDLLKVSN